MTTKPNEGEATCAVRLRYGHECGYSQSAMQHDYEAHALCRTAPVYMEFCDYHPFQPTPTQPGDDAGRAGERTLMSVVLRMAQHGSCEAFGVHGFGQAAPFIGCELFRSDDPEEYCLRCEALAALETLKPTTPTTTPGEPNLPCRFCHAKEFDHDGPCNSGSPLWCEHGVRINECRERHETTPGEDASAEVADLEKKLKEAERNHALLLVAAQNITAEADQLYKKLDDLAEKKEAVVQVNLDLVAKIDKRQQENANLQRQLTLALAERDEWKAKALTGDVAFPDLLWRTVAQSAEAENAALRKALEAIARGTDFEIQRDVARAALADGKGGA